LIKQDDYEPLPSDLQMKNLYQLAVCSSQYITAIECRTVATHKSPKSTGQDVECSLERGLLCTGDCFDYEIRVLCDCGNYKFNFK
jgi:von Willebrand factor